jgi:hypothetical protein
MQYQIDWKDLKKWKYGGWRYTIGCIGVKSRYAMVIPLKTKTAASLQGGFTQIKVQTMASAKAAVLS